MKSYKNSSAQLKYKWEKIYYVATKINLQNFNIIFFNDSMSACRLVGIGAAGQ